MGYFSRYNDGCLQDDNIVHLIIALGCWVNIYVFLIFFAYLFIYLRNIYVQMSHFFVTLIYRILE